MAIGDIRPQEVQATEVEAPHVTADLQPAAEIRAAVPLTQAAVLDSDNAALRSSTAAPMQIAAADSSPSHGWNLQHIFEQNEDEEITSHYNKKEAVTTKSQVQLTSN